MTRGDNFVDVDRCEIRSVGERISFFLGLYERGLKQKVGQQT